MPLLLSLPHSKGHDWAKMSGCTCFFSTQPITPLVQQHWANTAYRTCRHFCVEPGANWECKSPIHTKKTKSLPNATPVTLKFVCCLQTRGGMPASWDFNGCPGISNANQKRSQFPMCLPRCTVLAFILSSWKTLSLLIQDRFISPVIVRIGEQQPLWHMRSAITEMDHLVQGGNNIFVSKLELQSVQPKGKVRERSLTHCSVTPMFLKQVVDKMETTFTWQEFYLQELVNHQKIIDLEQCKGMGQFHRILLSFFLLLFRLPCWTLLT